MSIQIKCQHCGTDFIAERTSRKYCSDSCKTLAYRKRKPGPRKVAIEKMERVIEKQNHLIEKQAKCIEVGEKLLKAFQEKAETEITELKKRHKTEVDAIIAEAKALLDQQDRREAERRAATKEKMKENGDNSSRRDKQGRYIAKTPEKQVKNDGPMDFIAGIVKGFNNYRQPK
jgi:hypothetical protein